MRRNNPVLVRLLLVVALVSSLLVPGWIAPARALGVPVTLSRTVTGAGAGKVATDFAPTHVAFSWRGPEGSGVAFRTFTNGKASRWRRAPEAHDMEHGNHHYSAVIAVSRPSAIEWRRAGTGRRKMSRITVDYLNTVDGPRRRVTVPAAAEAATLTPDIVTRKEWGADESLRGGCALEHYRVQQLFVHHTVGSNNDPHPKATMRSIYWYHTVRRGWCDIGYNFVISPDGRVFEGRWARRYERGEVHDGETRNGRIVTGAHVSGYNSGSVGVSLMGNYSKVHPSKKMRKTLVKFLAWEARRHGLKPRATHTYRNPSTGLTRRLPVIAGHRDAGSTECPGNKVYKALPSIRRAVAQLVQKRLSLINLDSEKKSIVYGDDLELTGRLLKRSGAPLVDRRVVLKRRRATGGSWSKRATVRTQEDGSFLFAAKPLRTGKYKAVFAGDKRFRRSASDPLRMPVHAAVTLRVQGGVDVDGVPHFAGAPVPFAGEVMPVHSGHSVVLKVEQLVAAEYVVFDKVELVLDEVGAYSYELDAPSGSYRARAVFPTDGDHARGVSPDVNFVVAP